MVAISKNQIKALQTARRRAGLDDDVYHDWLYQNCGARSTCDLTAKQATMLLTRLGLRKRPKRARPVRRPADNTAAIRLVTPHQQRYITALIAQVDWHKDDGYQCWLQHRFGIGRVATLAQASKVIEGLKHMVSS